MQKHPRVLALVAAALVATTGCGDTDPGLTTSAPSPLRLSSPSLSISPSVVSSQLVSNPLCPSVPPARAEFDLNLQAGESQTLFITGVRLGFTPTSNVQFPPVTLPAPIPMVPFGSALVQARSTRTIPVSVGLGCPPVGRTGTIMVTVDVRDELGRPESLQATVVVR